MAPGPSGITSSTKGATSWNVDVVVEWLNTLELGHLAGRFRESGVDGAFLMELTVDEMINELNLTKLQAKKIILRLPK